MSTGEWIGLAMIAALVVGVFGFIAFVDDLWTAVVVFTITAGIVGFVAVASWLLSGGAS